MNVDHEAVARHVATRNGFGEYVDVIVPFRYRDCAVRSARVDDLLELIAERRGRNPEAMQTKEGTESC